MRKHTIKSKDYYSRFVNDSRVRRPKNRHHLPLDEDYLKMIALFDKMNREKIAAHYGEYGKTRKKWEEEQTATK